MRANGRDASEYERRPCKRCQSADGVRVRRKIAANGVTQYTWWCTTCDGQATDGGTYGLWLIPHKVVEHWYETGRLSIPPEELPIVADFRQQSPCVICGDPGEYHHWAPRALAEFFGDDWQAWPGDVLCRHHHEQWHSIVTWAMPGPTRPDTRVVERYSPYISRVSR